MAEKKSSSLKIIALVALSLFAVVSLAAIYYASTLVSDEEVRKIVLQQIEKTFPAASVELGELNVSAGFNFHFNMESLKISLEDTQLGSDLVSLSGVVVKVPVWAILTGGGEIDININEPKLDYREKEESSNWSRAMAGNTSSKNTSAKMKEDSVGELGASSTLLTLPVFLTKSSLNLRIKDIALGYATEDTSGSVILSKFLIKNINLETPTAFEIDSDLSLSMKDDKASFSTLIIGEFNIFELLSNKRLPLKAMVRTNKIKLPGMTSDLGELRTDIQISLEENGSLQGALKNVLEGITADLDFSLNKGELKIFNIKIAAQVGQLLKISNHKGSEISAGKSQLLATGSLKIDQEGKIVPLLNFKLDPAIVYQYDSVPAQITAEGTYQKNNIEVNVQTDVFSGVVTTKISGKHNLNEIFDLAQLQPFRTVITANNLKIPGKFIKDQLYSNSKNINDNKTVESDQTEVDEATVATPFVLPPGRITMNMNNVLFDDKELTAVGNFVLSGNSITTDALTFNYARGEGKLTHVTKIENEAMKHQFDFSLKNFDLSGIDPFLPAFVGGTKGIFNSSIKGSATTGLRPSQTRYDTVISVDATNGEVVALDISDQLNSIIQKIPLLKDKVGDEKSFDFDGKFQKLSVRSKATDKKIDFSRLSFVGMGNKVEMSGEGVLYPPPHNGQSQVILNVTERSGKISKIMLDSIGDNTLPIRLSGPGLSLAPDYEYTLNRLAKTAMKKKGSKKIEEVKVKAKEKLNEKLKEKGAEKLKRLLGR